MDRAKIEEAVSDIKFNYKAKAVPNESSVMYLVSLAKQY
jgi:hypothetical protein